MSICSLDGRRALVTGAAGGLGGSLAASDENGESKVKF